MVDNAFDGVVVTDQNGRVYYANAAYLELIGAASADDVRPIERVFIGDPDVSEAIYRLLKAAREGRRLQEEVRVAAGPGEAGRWLRLRVRPLDEGKRDTRMTVWAIADVTRERERQENVFQELQHAIDYLDHAPAGFFSVDAKGAIVYLNATLADWLDHDLAQVGAGSLKLTDIVAGEGASLLDHAQRGAGRGAHRSARPRSQDPHRQAGAGAAVPQGRLRRRRDARRLAHAGAQPGARRRRRSGARGGSSLHALLPAYADGDRHSRQDRTHRAQQCALCRRMFEGMLRATDRSILSVVAERDRPALEAAIRKAAEGQGDIAPVEAALAGHGERWANFFVSAVEEAERDSEAAIVYALETTDQRTLENRFNQHRKWSRSANSPAALRTISTTCCPPS